MVHRVAVVGANGFVGKYVSESLRVAKGHCDAQSLSRSDLDLLQPDTWKALWSHLDSVVLAAGLIDAERDALFRVNADATADFARYCLSRGVKKFILLSTGAVYGPVDAPTHPGMEPHPTSEYGKSKLAGERLVQEIFGERSAVVRLYFPFGARQMGRRLIPRLIENIRGGETVTCRSDGGPRLSLTHASDIAAIIRDDFVFKSNSGTHNVASAHTASIEDIVTQIARALDDDVCFDRTGNGTDVLSEPYRADGWRRFDATELVGDTDRSRST